MTPNVTFTISRSGLNTTGYLRPAYPEGLEHGEAGSSTLKYSHVLIVDNAIDIRDGYSYGSIGAGQDTIHIPNSSDPLKVAYLVIFVELAGISYAPPKRVYLQRQNVPTGSANL